MSLDQVPRCTKDQVNMTWVSSYIEKDCTDDAEKCEGTISKPVGGKQRTSFQPEGDHIPT